MASTRVRFTPLPSGSITFRPFCTHTCIPNGGNEQIISHRAGIIRAKIMFFPSYTIHTCYRHRSICQTYRGTWQQFKYLSNCVCANLICTLFDPSSLPLPQSPAESVKKCELKTGDSHGRSIERVLKKGARGR